MELKKVVATQYKEIVNKAVAPAMNLKIPPEGWIHTVRAALGMSVIQLASRLNVSRALIARAEKAELNNAVTLKTMNKFAEAMGCRFVYAIVPKENIDALILKQARLKAKYLVNKANIQMALEDQLLSDEKIQFEIDRLTQEIINGKHSDLWDIEWE
jgi:predicted DNA-binding mobile mystery protein A